jgi:predicted metal-binding membrane protein
LEVVLKRDRLIVLAGLVGISGLAWVYVGYLAWDMGHMDMSMEMAMPRMQTWSVLDLVLLFIMWAVMMVAMMVPTAASMILIFAKVQRQRRAQERPYVPTGIFLSGYLLVWAGFSMLASHSRRRRMLLKINDLYHSSFVNIRTIESTTYAFYAIRNAASFALSH